MSDAYSYTLTLLREDGSSVGHASVQVDWEPAREWTRFLAIRRGRLASDAFERGCAVEPIWHPDFGEPYLGGFRVRMGLNGEGELCHEFPTAYFRALAQEASADLVAEGTLTEGERFRYLAAAFASAAETRERSAGVAFRTEAAAPSLPLHVGSFASALEASLPKGRVEAADIPVFLPWQVLEESGGLAREAGAKETGGVLIGHLRRDSAVPEAFVEVTAQIPARHTEASSNRLTFTSETWTDVRAALELRGAGEVMLGWWHSHPVQEWCKDCPEEKQKRCPLSRDFLSEHDRALHRTVFPRAYSMALVVNDVPGGPTFSLFGWREGLIEPRGFHVVGADESAARRWSEDGSDEAELSTVEMDANACDTRGGEGDAG